MSESFRIEPLSPAHDRASFDSGSAELDRYLREQASQDLRRRVATCFVAVTVETGQVVGFYTLAASSLPLAALDAELTKKLPRYPVVPAVLVGRLAVASAFQGTGIGRGLLANAIMRVLRAELGVFAIIVDAKDDAAERFYLHHGFTPLAGPKRRLVLPIASALKREALRR